MLESGARAGVGGRGIRPPCGGPVRAHRVLVTYVVEGNTAVAGRRFCALEENLTRTTVKNRKFFSPDRQLVATERFRRAFRAAFDAGFREWARKLENEGTKLQSGRQGGGYHLR
ncbi:unnamed protein product, partial [Pylaiella littoralis]